MEKRYLVRLITWRTAVRTRLPQQIFDSQLQGYFEWLAHLVEQKPFKFCVVGSIPTLFNLVLEYFLQINFGALVQLVVMPLCHSGGHGFESRTHRKISIVKYKVTSIISVRIRVFPPWENGEMVYAKVLKTFYWNSLYMLFFDIYLPL